MINYDRHRSRNRRLCPCLTSSLYITDLGGKGEVDTTS